MLTTTIFQHLKDHTDELRVILALCNENDIHHALRYIEKNRIIGIQELIFAAAYGDKVFSNLAKEELKLRKDWQTKIWRKTGFIKFSNWVYNNKSIAHILRILLTFLGIFFIVRSLSLKNDKSHSLVSIFSIIILSALILFFFEYTYSQTHKPLNMVIGNSKLDKMEDNSMIYDSMEVAEQSVDAISTMMIAFFFILQLGIFFWSKQQLDTIKNGSHDANLQLKLIDNEEQLFDMGLYIGLAGTILSLLFLSLGHENQGLMSAYTSTLFGIMEVALFKLMYLRPYKMQLLLNTNSEESKSTD
jgi:hypothetical protein